MCTVCGCGDTSLDPGQQHEHGDGHDHHHHHHGHDHDHDHRVHGAHHHAHDHDHKHDHDLNLRSAYLHVIMDAATSVLAIAALLPQLVPLTSLAVAQSNIEQVAQSLAGRIKQ